MLVEYIAYLLIGWNLIVFLVYGYDKMCAVKGYWRVPELTLLVISFLWGSIGAFLGVFIFNHKTNKWLFRIALPMFLFLQVAFAGWLVYYMSM